jgi:hypothetical protein
MNLYAVRIAVDIVVCAPDEAKASEIAIAHERDERAHAKADTVTRVIDSAKLPGNWDAGCLPYGRQDDTTIGEIIGYPPAPAEEESCPA